MPIAKLQQSGVRGETREQRPRPWQAIPKGVRGYVVIKLISSSASFFPAPSRNALAPDQDLFLVTFGLSSDQSGDVVRSIRHTASGISTARSQSDVRFLVGQE